MCVLNFYLHRHKKKTLVHHETKSCFVYTDENLKSKNLKVV